MTENVYQGVVHGRTIELEREPSLPDVQSVRVTVIASGSPTPPTTAEALERLKLADGGWADDVNGLDRFLEWNRQRRKSQRREIPG